MNEKQTLTGSHRGPIPATAEWLFAEKGTEKTATGDIAWEAGYSETTPYVYFQSKEEIISTTLLGDVVLLKKKIHEAIEGHSDWYQVYDAVRRSIVWLYDENPTAYDVATGTMSLVWEADKTQRGAADILRVSGKIDEELATFLVRSAAEGAVRSQLPSMKTVPLFQSALLGMVHTADIQEGYIQETIGLSREEFPQHDTRLLLASITKVSA